MKAVFRFILIIFAVFLLIFILVFVFSAAINEKRLDYKKETTPIRQPSGDELRAVWVPYMSLALPQDKRSEEGFKAHFDAIVHKAADSGFNALIVHVRSHGDALYPSRYYPWSHLLTGTQGMDPGYDPLAYMIEASHKAGLAFHAWINPLRIKTGNTPNLLSAENPHMKWTHDKKKSNDRWTVQINDGIFFNPAYAEARAYIIDGVREIVEKYAVDGIHFDDYFYPVNAEATNPFDQKEYNTYRQKDKAGTPLSLLEWRTANMNTFISGVYTAIKSIRPAVQFGISPQANFENCKEMGADVRTWGSRNGYVDYLCPQVYFSFDHQTHPFEKVCTEWSRAVTAKQVKLYIGLALYKAGQKEELDAGWTASDDIIGRQILFGRETLHWDGFMVYSYEQLDNDQTKREKQHMIDILRQD